LLSENVAKGKQEKHEEEVLFAEFSEWCDNTSTDKQRSIDSGKRQIEQLTADIKKARSDAKVLVEEIGALNGQINGWGEDKTSAQAQRASERKDFNAVRTDYSESIDAIGRAISVLKAKSADTKQSALIQSNLSTFPSSA